MAFFTHQKQQCLCSHIKFHVSRWLKIDPEASTIVGVADKPNFQEGYNAMSSLPCKRKVSHDTLFSGWETRWWNFSASVRCCPPRRVHWHQDFNSRIAFIKQNKLYEKAERLLIAPSRTVRPRQLSLISLVSHSLHQGSPNYAPRATYDFVLQIAGQTTQIPRLRIFKQITAYSKDVA
jgi:hypothetical protein